MLLLSTAIEAAETEIFTRNFPISGEKLEREEVDILIKECCDPEDDDGFIPYERKCEIKYLFVQLLKLNSKYILIKTVKY